LEKQTRNGSGLQINRRFQKTLKKQSMVCSPGRKDKLTNTTGGGRGKRGGSRKNAKKKRGKRNVHVKSRPRGGKSVEKVARKTQSSPANRVEKNNLPNPASKPLVKERRESGWPTPRCNREKNGHSGVNRGLRRHGKGTNKSHRVCKKEGKAGSSRRWRGGTKRDSLHPEWPP